MVVWRVKERAEGRSYTRQVRVLSAPLPFHLEIQKY